LWQDPDMAFRRRLVRALAGAWLVLAAVTIAFLAGEAWLRFERLGDVRASERFRATNVFFANAMELQAGTHSLWARRWQEYEPGAKVDVVVGGERFVVQMNSRGYRTHEFAVPKPDGLVRVICIGGSTTVAGRTNDETYPAFLERKLRLRFPGLPLEVLDLGVSAVTTQYWYARLDEVLGYEPDLVVQYQAINDISWRHLPRYAPAHRLRGWAYRSLLLQRLFPFPVAELDPYLHETFVTLGDTARACNERGVAYLGATFALPDPDRARGEFRRHLDYNAEYWMRRFPMHSYATWGAIARRYNRLYVDFAQRYHVPYVRVDERLDDPALFIDVCHFTPEGIERLADAFLPAVADLVEDTPGYRRWAEAASAPGTMPPRGGGRAHPP
jgi:lysophospholipase L1-like esterase